MFWVLSLAFWVLDFALVPRSKVRKRARAPARARPPYVGPHADKRARSFRNCSVSASVAAERLFLHYEHEHEHKHDSPNFGVLR
jgi:hypothetical protein